MKQVYVSLLSLMLLAGCSSMQATPSPTPEPKILKVAVLAPVTGPSAASGQEIKEAATMAFEQVNYTVGDYKIEPVWIDSQSDPEVAARAYEQAIVKEGVQVGLLNWNSSVSVAVMEITAKHKIPHFFGMGATEVINQKIASNPAKYNYWNFKGWPMSAKLSQNYVTVLEEAIAKGLWKPTTKRVGIYGEDTDWGHGFGNGLKAQLEAAGWEVVKERYFAIDETDFSAGLAEFKEAKVTLLVGTTTSESFFANFIKQTDQADLDAVLVADGLGWIGNWHEQTGVSSDDVLDQIPLWATDKAKQFAKEYETRWGHVPSPSSAGLSYDLTHFFVKILQATYEQNKRLNSETIYRFAQENVQTGQMTYKEGVIMQEYKYTPETVPDPVVGAGFYTFPVIQYHAGKGVVVWPPDWREADFKAKP